MKYEDFIKLAVKHIQTDYNTQSDCIKALTYFLNVADEEHKRITGQPIVARRESESRNVLEIIAGVQPLKTIPK